MERFPPPVNKQTNKQTTQLKVMLNSPLLFRWLPTTKVNASGVCDANWSGGKSAFNINDECRAYICMFCLIKCPSFKSARLCKCYFGGSVFKSN